MSEKRFNIDPMERMVSVGKITDHSARIWLRVPRAGEYMIKVWDKQKNMVHEQSFAISETNHTDNTYSTEIGPDLSPMSRYDLEVIEAEKDTRLSDAQFETTPRTLDQTPDQFSVGLLSCNQPFDDNGELRPSAGQMLEAAYKAFKEHNTKLVLMVGDQIYSDYPQSRSLFRESYFQQIDDDGCSSILECSSQQVRKHFQMRYRQFRNLEGWEKIHKEFPTLPILDDHDMVDNWGSNPQHQQPKWQTFKQGALLAFQDYQGGYFMPVTKELPPNFQYNFEYGYAGFFVMDLRCERREGENGQLYSRDQEKRLEQYLDENGDKKAIFIILSVPIVHLPKFLARWVAKLTSQGEDFSDRWSSGSQRKDRDRMLHLLYNHQINHPEQKIVLLSGDIHIGCAHAIVWPNQNRFYQLVSSAITHDDGLIVTLGAKGLIKVNKSIKTENNLKAKIYPLKGEKGKSRNPFGGLNVGLISFQNKYDPQIHYSLYSHKGNEPVCVFQSQSL
jgi:alkaline phosphatase D